MTGYGFPVAVLAAAAGLFTVQPLLGPFWQSLLINILMYGALATAWGLFSGPTRYVSLATAAFFGLGAYTMAFLGEAWPLPLVYAAAAAIGAVVAALVGLSTLRISGVHFVIFTFGLAELIRQLVTWAEATYGGTVGRFVFVPVSTADIVVLLIAATAAVLLTGWWIGRSRLGWALRAIGEDEMVARHAGIDATRAKIAAFVVQAAFMALIGCIMAPRWTYIDATIAFNPVISFQVLIMALLGGAGRLLGPLLGTIPLVILFELLQANFPNSFSVLLGLVFLAVVYLLPRGIAGLLERRA
jgi:branched-chain amino acid transport system permease protein